jgi:hypothetical protein
MLRRCLPNLRLLLFALLALATLVRPLLIAACDIHAVAHAHAAQPHHHAGEGDAGGADGDGHGVHESLQQGSLAAVADAVAPFELPTLAFEAVALPDAPSASIAAHYAGAPFRPPIG